MTHTRTLPHGTHFPFTEALVREVPVAGWAVNSPAGGRRQLPVLGGAPSFTPCPAERIWLDGGYWSQAHLQGEGHWASGSARLPSGDITSKDVPSDRPKPRWVSMTSEAGQLLLALFLGCLRGLTRISAAPLPGEAGAGHSSSSKYWATASDQG